MSTTPCTTSTSQRRVPPVATRAGFAIIAALAAGSAVSAPDPSRQQALEHLLYQDCGSCHGMTMQGGLGPPLTPEALAGKPDELLVNSILKGRSGTAMPPWEPFLSAEEAQWLVQQLRQPPR